jgi:hypothetical protein
MLGNSCDAQVFHGELAGIDLALSLVLDSVNRDNSLAPGISSIYSDNKASLQFLQKREFLHSQSLAKRILLAVDTLAEKQIHVQFRWLPGHKGIDGNEQADKTAKSLTTLTGPIEKPATRYLSALKRAIKKLMTKDWQIRWKTGTKGRQSAYLIPEPTPEICKLHAGKEKAFSALLVQLRTGIIGFNSFLHKRGVPTIRSPRCICDMGEMTVRHILINCPNWNLERHRFLSDFHTTDIRRILNSPKGAAAAVNFILSTGILAQFRQLAREEQATLPGFDST